MKKIYVIIFQTQNFRYGLLGQDLIYEIRLNKYIDSSSLKDSIKVVYNPPTEMVENMIVYRDRIITSGEDTNKVYISKYKYKDK
jgi:hypothetical protein